MTRLDAADLTLLRTALAVLKQQGDAFANFAAQFTQGQAQTRALLAIGDRARHIHTLDCLLRDELGHLTGQPAIQHGNRDLHDPANEPLTPAEEAREANLRG